MDKIHYLSMLVKNSSGVLTRISGLIARRGYNIDSLSVCATEDSNYSRMTIALPCDDKSLLQLKRQLQNQQDVDHITELDKAASILRELLLVKVAIPAENRSQIIDICSIFKAKTIDLSTESMILELTGAPSKIDAFIAVLNPYDIIELARSGVSALHRGTTAIKDFSAEIEE